MDYSTCMFCSCVFSILQTSEVCPTLLSSIWKSHLRGSEVFGDYFNIVKKWQKQQDEIIEGIRNIKYILCVG